MTAGPDAHPRAAAKPVRDRLIDALFGWGAPADALDRVREHLAAGADHVCIQPIPDRGRTSLDDLRVIAAELR